mmetsp:Transcript_110561/g.263580  ORF Transcript_110561/g.263580 Transcript_110561/m.263580 type:complete len:261 (-) Transcript_110561:8-790(-)
MQSPCTALDVFEDLGQGVVVDPCEAALLQAHLQLLHRDPAVPVRVQVREDLPDPLWGAVEEGLQNVLPHVPLLQQGGAGRHLRTAGQAAHPEVRLALDLIQPLLLLSARGGRRANALGLVHRTGLLGRQQQVGAEPLHTSDAGLRHLAGRARPVGRREAAARPARPKPQYPRTLRHVQPQLPEVLAVQQSKILHAHHHLAGQRLLCVRLGAPMRRQLAQDLLGRSRGLRRNLLFAPGIFRGFHRRPAVGRQRGHAAVPCV